MLRLQGDNDSVLRLLPMYVQVFDPRTSAFDELRNTGALSTLPDPAVQRAIVEYFAATLDFAESNQFLRTDQFALQDAWQRAGIVASDWIPMEEFLHRLSSSPEALAALRRNFVRAKDQAEGYPMLADSFEARGHRMVEDARALLAR